MTPTLDSGRLPNLIRDDLWLFPPNRDTKGGSSWFLKLPCGAVLIDCPPISEATFSFLKEHSQGIDTHMILSGRDGHGRLPLLMKRFSWPVFVQEQEHYLLPGLEGLLPFGQHLTTDFGIDLHWMPGPSPGSAVVLVASVNLLFCGHLLTPLAPGRIGPIRTSRTFHWTRQQSSLQVLRSLVSSHPSLQLASGAPLGALRGVPLVPLSGWLCPDKSF